MAKLDDIIGLIENFAPPETAEEWDNTGWQIKLDNSDIKKVMLCVSVTDTVLAQAIDKKADLIISHHPCIFPHIKSIQDKKYIDAIKNDIQIYCAHTNFDRAKGGTTDCLAAKIGLEVSRDVGDYLKLAVFENEVQLDHFILKIKIALNAEKVKVVNYAANKPVKTVALCAGAGADYISEAQNLNADVYITSDIKYHDTENIKQMTLLDFGHLETEKPSLAKLASILEKESLEIINANEKNPWIYI